MRVRKLLRRRMVTTGFADRGLFGAETESAKKGLPRRAVSVVECGCSGADATPSPSRRGLKLRVTRHRSTEPALRCNTVPIEKGTETARPAHAPRPDSLDATPSPSRRGLKRNRRGRGHCAIRDATPSP